MCGMKRTKSDLFHVDPEDEPSWACTSYPKHRVWKRHVSRLRYTLGRKLYVHRRGCTVCMLPKPARAPSRYVRILLANEHLAHLIAEADARSTP
jgi:hypothetical protein